MTLMVISNFIDYSSGKFFSTIIIVFVILLVLYIIFEIVYRNILRNKECGI